MPWGEPVENLPEELFEALPRPIERSMMNMDSMMGDGDMDTDGMMSSSPNSDMVAPGRWLGCGSCNTCGHPANECVTSPEGACLWDPATCQAGNLVLVNGRSMYNPVYVECSSAAYFGSIFLSYNDPSGAYQLVSGNASGPVSNIWVTSTGMEIGYICPGVGNSAILGVSATDSGGATFNYSFTLKGK